MKTSVRKMAILLIVLSVLVAACTANDQNGASNGEKTTVKIGYLPITHAAPLYIEDELGDDFFEHFELELVRFGSWPELMDALNTGRIDGASVLAQLGMLAKEEGIDLSAVALGHKDGNVIVTDPSIDSVEDLAGESFAIPSRYSTHNALLYQMLEDGGLDYDDVEAVELPPAEMPAALSEGRISGYAVAEPFGAISVAMETGNVLYHSDEIWAHSICCLLVLRDDFIENQSEAAQEFVTEYVNSGAAIHDDHDHSHDVIADYMDVEDDVLELSMEWISYDDLYLNEEDYEQLAQYLIDMGLSENPPAYEDFVDNSLIEEAL